MSDRLTILQGDFEEQSEKIAPESIPLVVTSPPYDNLRTYGTDKPFDFEAMARAIDRVLMPGGVICWNVNDSVVEGSETLTSFKQAIFFKEVLGLRVHDTMIYEKSNFSHPDSSRYHQLFEFVFIFSKGKQRCFNPIVDKQNLWAGTGTFGQNTAREADGYMSLRKRNIISEFGKRGNVWSGKTRGQEEICTELKHPAMMPKWLAKDLIISWSNPGDVVLDPMAGSGTVGAQAIETGRRTILCERNPEYIPIIEKQCFVTPGLPL